MTQHVETEETLTNGAWACALLVATLFLIIILFAVRLYNKAGADIQNPKELSRMAAALEDFDWMLKQCVNTARVQPVKNLVNGRTSIGVGCTISLNFTPDGMAVHK